MVRDNTLTDGVCLKVPGKLLVFYKEQTSSIWMDLSELEAPLRAVSVDTCSEYKEVEIAGLNAAPGQLFRAPHHSDWAVVVRRQEP